MTDATDTTAITTETIELPPADVVAEMVKAPAATKSPLPAAERPVARLAFVSPRQKVVVLEAPFELDGRIVDQIVVRSLTTAELGAVVDDKGASFTKWDLYAAMTGLPPEVLSGLDAVDGAEVTEAAHAFFPKPLRG